MYLESPPKYKRFKKFANFLRTKSGKKSTVFITLAPVAFFFAAALKAAWFTSTPKASDWLSTAEPAKNVRWADLLGHGE
jgi:hypothetical protein